jgi:hypothetical protein
MRRTDCFSVADNSETITEGPSLQMKTHARVYYAPPMVPSDKLLRAVTVSRGLFPILYCITSLTPYNRENRARSGRVEEQGARWAREVLLSSLSVRELFYALSEQSAVDVAGAMQDADDLNACRNDAIENEVREFDQGAGFGAYVRPSGT